MVNVFIYECTLGDSKDCRSTLHVLVYFGFVFIQTKIRKNSNSQPVTKAYDRSGKENGQIMHSR